MTRAIDIIMTRQIGNKYRVDFSQSRMPTMTVTH